MECRIYQPAVVKTTVVDPYNNPANLTYVSNSSLAYWGGKYWAAMDGTDIGLLEGSAGQQIWMTTSEDAENWSTPFRPFRDADRCTNPVSGTSFEWQPNLVIVGDKLWCTWTGRDAYVSVLSDPDGLWTTQRFEFNGTNIFTSTTVVGPASSGRSVRAQFGGVEDWWPFFSQNPIVLRSGAVACPLTLTSLLNFSTQTTAKSGFTRQLKTNALFIYRNGQWSLSLVDTSEFGDFIAWEPFVVENPIGQVYVFHRSLDGRVDEGDFVLVSRSSDDAKTFGAAKSAGMVIPSTRGFARQTSRRHWLMTHIDHPQGGARGPDRSISANRVNGALFVSRRGSEDFIPGVNWSGDDWSVNYPQFIVDGDSLRINYTSGGVGVRRSMQLVTVSPLPTDDYAWIHPRSVSRYNSPFTDPELVSDDPDEPDHYVFEGVNSIKSLTQLTASTGVTYVMWSQSDTISAGTLIDSRGLFGGQVLTFGGLVLRSVAFAHGFTLPPGPTVYFFAATVNSAARTVTMWASNGNGEMLTATQYFRSFSYGETQPEVGDTLTVDGTTYTFRASASASTDIIIGDTVTGTVNNIVEKVEQRNAFRSGVLRPPPVDGFSSERNLVIAKADFSDFALTSGSSAFVTNEVPLSGDRINIGASAIAGSSLGPFIGKLYQARVYTTALSEANIRHLHNSRAAEFGHDIIDGSTSAPGDPAFLLDASDPDITEFPPSGNPLQAFCEVVDDELHIYGEASASVELPYGANRVTIRYRLGQSPSGTDEHVVATFGNVAHPARLWVDTDLNLRLNRRLVESIDDPTEWQTITVAVSTGKVSAGSVEIKAAGKPRMYLGSAFPQGRLGSDKYVAFDSLGMSVVKAVSGS